MKYTYKDKTEAHAVHDNMRVIVPDQVGDNQRDYNGVRVPCLDVRTGKRIYARLRGDLYGLHTTGTGDMIVARGN